MEPKREDESDQLVSSSNNSTTAMPNVLVVDARGCFLKDDFYVKELAFFNTLRDEYWVGTFKPPMDRSYLKKKYVKDIDRDLAALGLEWEGGTFPYQVAFTMLNYFGKDMQLYARGNPLCQWIQQYTSLCPVNVEELGYPPRGYPEDPQDPVRDGGLCPYHPNPGKCALDGAMHVGLYMHDLFSLKS